MANKDFIIDDDLAVTVYKRRGNRNLRLSVAPGGKVRVSIPAWAPYRTGLDFAKSRRTWIMAQQPSITYLQHGQAVGKAHHLVFENTSAAKVSTRLTDTSIIVRYPPGSLPSDEKVQAAAHEACVRALRKQAEQLLPQRLASLAEK